MAVSVYNLISEAKVPTATWHDPKHLGEVRSRTQYYNTQTGERLIDRDLKKAQVFGGETIQFETDEVERMKRLASSTPHSTKLAADNGADSGKLPLTTGTIGSDSAAQIESKPNTSTAESLHGLRLLGFKPIDKCIKPIFHYRASAFIYPDDKAVKGSAQLYTALLRRCAERRVAPICRLVARANMPPRLVALLPQYTTDGQGA
jgi:ATP-dependent DNA helicase 2 subunit 1